MSFQGKPLIESSELRLELKDQVPLGVNVRIVNATAGTKDETYQLLAGKASSVRITNLELEEPAGRGRTLVMEARAYDDAVAFRYLIPKQPTLQEFPSGQGGNRIPHQ